MAHFPWIAAVCNRLCHSLPRPAGRRRPHLAGIQSADVEALELRHLLTSNPVLAVAGPLAPIAMSDTYSVNENQLLHTQQPGTAVEPASVTRLQMTSDPEDWIGDGQTYDYGIADGRFRADLFSNIVTIGFEGTGEFWTLHFVAPNSAPLTEGTYLGATDYLSGEPGTPGLEVTGNGRGTSSVIGEFTIKQIRLASAGNVQSFWATFDQYSDGSSGGLHGEIQYNAVEDSPTADIPDTVSTTLPLGIEEVTQIQMSSEAGDYIGDGQTYQYLPTDGTFHASGRPNAVTVTFQSLFDNWTFQFDSPNDEPLTVGTYTEATRYPFNQPGHPGMDVYGNGRGSNELVGSFTIKQLVYGATGELQRFWATFEQHSGHEVPALRGVVQYNALVDTSAGTSILANDTDPDADPLRAVLVSLPKHGRVTLNPDGSFVYVPDRNYSGVDQFTYRATDGAHDSNIATVTLNVRQVNAAPIGQPRIVQTKRNKLYVFGKRDFKFEDPGNKPKHAIAGVKITSLPTRGSLSLHGLQVIAGMTISIADIKAGRLTFIPDHSGEDASTSEFTFQIQDNGGTANGGVDTDITPRRMTIQVR